MLLAHGGSHDGNREGSCDGALPLRSSRKASSRSRLHRYTATDGSEIYRRIRAKHPGTGEKWIRPMYANGSGYKLGEPDFGGKPKPLYRLHELVAADRLGRFGG